MEQDTQLFHPKLPSRIAGVVFWMLVLVAFSIAVYYFNSIETKERMDRNENMALLVREMVDVIDRAKLHGQSIDQIKTALVNDFSHYKRMTGFTSIDIIGFDGELNIDHPNANDDVVVTEITKYSNYAGIGNITLKVYFENGAKRIHDIRKHVFLGIGIGIFVIGLLLRYFLNIMLTRPFVAMLKSAKDFTQGDEEVRFDELRNDEFGYLGIFINNALETTLNHQAELMVAIKRVSESELALSTEKEIAEVTLRSITDSVVTVDKKGRVTFINPAAEMLLGYTLDEAMGLFFLEISNLVDDYSEVLDVNPIKDCFETGEIVNFPEQSSLLNKNSELFAIEACVAPMKNEKGDSLGAVVVIQNVSHTRKLTNQLSHQASHDALTGLYNRRKFDSYLKEVLINTVLEDKHHVLLYLDLDQFKVVNDTCGHIAGDELLQQLPLIFSDILRSGDVIARLGGDEFGVLLENCSLDQSITIANKVRESIKEFRFVWEDKTFEIGVSIGVVAIDSEHTNLTQILSSADIACYAAKDAGRNRIHIYEESDAVVTKRHGEMRWTSRITEALEENRFCLYGQNIVNVKTGTIEHVEVLLRMISKDGSIILPGAFLPAAERFNLMAAIDRWVITNTFKLVSLSAFKGSDGAMRGVAVNLSGDSLNDNSLLDFILSEKEKYNVPLDKVCFEITETVAISNLSHAVTFIGKLNQYGCKFSLDDFGSGLSSFAYLKTLPVDYLKIDGSFVRDIAIDKIDKAMVKSIQQVANAMNLKTIAEWVENEDTLDVLKELDVDCVQGNYILAPEAITCDS